MSDLKADTEFSIQIIQFVLEDLRFAHRKDYLTLSPQQKIEGLNSEVGVEVQGEQGSDKALIRLRAKCDAPDSLYSFTITYVAMVKVQGPSPENLTERLAATGAGFLMPFVRETIASLTGKGRFGPIWLSPVNFSDALRKNPLKPKA